MRLVPDAPIGSPSFELSEDELDTVIDLLCRGAADARALLKAGMLEVPITIHVKKAARRLKRELGLANIEIGGEFELLAIDSEDPEVLGRIDITVKFLQQFGDEDNYLGVECKRIAHGDSSLSQRYVTQGVHRFASGQYGAGHAWGMMLGYVLKPPSDSLVSTIDKRIRQTYGDEAKLECVRSHVHALSIQDGRLVQGEDGHEIRIVHLFVDMATAASTVDSKTA